VTAWVSVLLGSNGRCFGVWFSDGIATRSIFPIATSTLMKP
jgi:hypothetical protein